MAAISAKAIERKPTAMTFQDYLTQKAAERAAAQSDDDEANED
jgi:hypothetical protein